MPTNQQVINSFMKGRQCRGANLWSTGAKLYSYQTCIAQWDVIGSRMIVNKTKYSRTTSNKHQGPLRSMLIDKPNIEVIEVQKCPWGVDELENYIKTDTNHYSNLTKTGLSIDCPEVLRYAFL